MSYDTVIFDLDGTLLDTLQDLADSTNYALSACALPPRTSEEIRSFVGNGVGLLIARAVPEGTPDEIRGRCLELFRAHYLLNMENKTAPYPGVVELLGRLGREGYKLAIVSNKLDSAVKGLAQSHFDGLAPVAIGERPGVKRKPAPDMVRLALDELGSSADQAVYVGDSDVDLETARNAGLPCVSVSWGFRDQAFLLEHGATHLAHSTEELYRTLHAL